jgi:hypothetical protein
MYKNINKFLCASGLAIVLLGSCSKDFITKNPTTSLGSDQALTDVAAMQTALNGAYAQLRSTSLFGRDFPITGDLMADNTFIETQNSGRYLSQFNYSLTNADGVFGGNWNAAYTGILNANNIIDAEVTGAEQIKAQAYALRALLYFKLVNIYARPYTDNPQGLGVPLILHYNPSLLPTRETVANVYAQIVSDLKAALQNAPEYASSIKLSKYAIQGLLARAYFYMGDYANAKSTAVDVIENSGFTLANTAAKYKAFWDNSSIQSDRNEVMFEVDVDAVNNSGSNDLGAIYNGGYTDIYASQQLVSLYSATDIRKAVILAGNTKSGVATNVVNKYPNYNNADKDNLKVIRLAELYLIAAESSLPANEADAKKYLNLLMSFRDPSFAGYTSSGSQLLQDIVTERRKELAFEGDRFYDLNRLKWDIVRGAQNAGSIPYQAYGTIPYTNERRIAPIPLAEIQANANIKSQQNPGY